MSSQDDDSVGGVILFTRRPRMHLWIFKVKLKVISENPVENSSKIFETPDRRSPTVVLFSYLLTDFCFESDAKSQVERRVLRTSQIRDLASLSSHMT
ncbi:hypothetical protein TNCT_523981 [Trichonephila clavata]|uniref:Uncharacterized protein n=1 Tax=Trichonephila clavata TaxID=2740835 RepID=A0A8X6J3F0_TRICU|nr:hypothetical protein TNCT_523981 [Trichonephila clavata]